MESTKPNPSPRGPTYFVRTMRGQTPGSATEYVRRVVDRIPGESWVHLQEAREFYGEADPRKYVRKCLGLEAEHAPQTANDRTGELEHVFAKIRGYAAACRSSFKTAERLYFVRLTVLSSLVLVLEAARDKGKTSQSLVDRESDDEVIRKGLVEFHEGIRKLVASGWDECKVTEMFVLCTLIPRTSSDRRI